MQVHWVEDDALTEQNDIIGAGFASQKKAIELRQKPIQPGTTFLHLAPAGRKLTTYTDTTKHSLTKPMKEHNMISVMNNAPDKLVNPPLRVMDRALYANPELNGL